jgi:DNA-binding transcriptional MerR regulator
MPVTINGIMLYRIGEALATAGVSRATYFRWVKDRRFPDAHYRDRNGRRLFTAEEVRALKGAAEQLLSGPQLSMPLNGR